MGLYGGIEYGSRLYYNLSIMAFEKGFKHQIMAEMALFRGDVSKALSLEEISEREIRDGRDFYRIYLNNAKSERAMARVWENRR